VNSISNIENMLACITTKTWANKEVLEKLEMSNKEMQSKSESNGRDLQSKMADVTVTQWGHMLG
jgi:hypothetical protein